jgi:hypothetical protein
MPAGAGTWTVNTLRIIDLPVAADDRLDISVY